MVSIIDDWEYEVFSNIQSATPKYFTFLQNYGSDSESIGGFYGIQTTTEDYRIIAKDNSDVVLKVLTGMEYLPRLLLIIIAKTRRL